jgi:hypothetical protein
VDFVMTDFAGLTAYLTSGFPPIALLSTTALPYWSESCDHVAVVVGVDDSWVYLNDPYFDSAPQQVSHSDFLLAWSPNAGLEWVVGYIRNQKEHHRCGKAQDRLERITEREDAVRQPIEAQAQPG